MLSRAVESEVKIRPRGNMCLSSYGNGNVNFFNLNCKLFFSVANFLRVLKKVCLFRLLQNMKSSVAFPFTFKKKIMSYFINIYL